MRTGICSVPQALTAEAATVVKQAVSLARRRGHAQVTPLHVASAMLASPTSLLRKACLQSHSHPLQCKALELCFNVALNRLPASTSSTPLLLNPHHQFHHHHSPRPSLSNALVAAFKRAQAHQRRGSIENQQQPILALKIELEQLVISILDDPSVSRVMREAGFNSSQVKTRVEQDVSLLEICSRSCPPPPPSPPVVISTHPRMNTTSSMFRPSDEVKNENNDVMSVLNMMVEKKRNTIIIGESLSGVEVITKGIIDKFERGQVPGDLRYAQFISLPLLSLRNCPKEEVQQKVVELRCLVKSYMGRGVVLYLGDLQWVSEFWSTYGEQNRNYYCVVEYIIMEIKRLVFETREAHEDRQRIWLMGIATFQTYMKCKAGKPSLENMWELHPLTIPVGSLSLSLNLDSDSLTQVTSKVPKHGFSWPLLENEVDNDKNLSHLPDFPIKLGHKESQLTATSFQKKESSLPSWLQQYKEESRRNAMNNDQECVKVIDLCQKVIDFASASSPSNSISSYQQNPNLPHQSYKTWPVIFEPKSSPKEQQFLWVAETTSDNGSNLIRDNTKQELLSNPNSSPNSASSSEAIEEDTEALNSFKVFNEENLKIFSDALEEKVPWQKEIIPEIASSILQCRSKSKVILRDDKEETWLFFLGDDNQGKEKVGREIARVVFGSQTKFTQIGLSNTTKKRARDDDLNSNYVERLGLALNESPRRVFFMEDIDHVDYFSLKGIKNAIDSGRIILPGGENVPLKDAIIIFSSDTLSSMSTAKKCVDQNDDDDASADQERSSGTSLDLNIAIELFEHENEDVHPVERILESVDSKFIFKKQES